MKKIFPTFRLNRLQQAIAASLVLGAVAAGVLFAPSQPEPRSVIVQGDNLTAVAGAVRAVGGAITHELDIIDAVGARLTAHQLETLRARSPGLRIFGNSEVLTSGAPIPDTPYRVQVGAEQLQQQGINGSGVTVAVIDTGMWYSYNDIKWDLNGNNRLVAQYNATTGQLQNAPDKSGHGTHIASVIASTKRSANGKPQGIAPMVKLVSVKAFDPGNTGSNSGTYADVIRGLNWVVTNKSAYNIRVLNLSFGTPPRSHYWQDPLNQAVMKAWKAGIVVVASAGNRGPAPMTVTVPGNVPYVITVGAMSDNWTPNNPNDDVLASFSSAGPTNEGFAKPEVVAPGGHLLGIMDNGNHQIARDHPEWVTPDDRLYTMSGTSQSAAVVSGVVALMLQAQPSLTPNQVKCRLMTTARPAVNASNQLSYSPLQQGAGMINAYDAVGSSASGCANRGLDVTKDLANTAHYGGPINKDAQGRYYQKNPNGLSFFVTS